MIGCKKVITILLLVMITIGCTKQVPINIIKSGVTNWNKWRGKNTSVRPDFREAQLSGAHLE